MDGFSVVSQPDADYAAQSQGNTVITIGDHYTSSFADFIADFHLYLQQWKSETAFDSDLDAITAHPGFQAIVALRERAVPLILNELRRGPSLLVYALEDINGGRPYPASMAGNIRGMTDCWLLWSDQTDLAAA
jgi:hypothetical protein